MKLFSSALIAVLCAATPALALDIQTLAPIRAVTVYPNGATITHVITADVPAGSHRVLFPISGDVIEDGPPRIRSTSGFVFGAQEFLEGHITDPELVYNSAQRAAFDALETAKDATEAQENRTAFAQATLDAAMAKVAFLRSISGTALEGVDPEALAQTAAMIGDQVADGLAAVQSAREALNADEETLQELRKQVEQAQRDFDRTAPPTQPVSMMAVSVELEEAQQIEFTLDYLIRSASWTVDYDLFLTRGAPASLSVSRKVLVGQFSGEVWDDIELTLSTANPGSQLEPTDVFPNQASLFNPQIRATSTMELSSRMQDSVMEEPVIMAEVGSTFAPARVDGLSVSYPYPDKVTVYPDDGYLILALGQFDLEAETFIRAAPRFDETAFLMATFTNTTPELMLPGTTSLYRNGTFVGRGDLGMLPTGAESTLAFGALENLRLDFKRLANDTGDTGIISRSDQRQQALEFSVENLSDEVQVVETIYALPFSEQEDLEVTIRARPRADALDFEQKRNVGRWQLALDPGQKQTVRLDVTLDWPQGQQLSWNP